MDVSFGSKFQFKMNVLPKQKESKAKKIRLGQQFKKELTEFVTEASDKNSANNISYTFNANRGNGSFVVPNKIDGKLEHEFISKINKDYPKKPDMLKFNGDAITIKPYAKGEYKGNKYGSAGFSTKIENTTQSILPSWDNNNFIYGAF